MFWSQKKNGFFEDDSEFFNRLVKAFNDNTVIIQKKLDNQKILQINIDTIKTYSLTLNSKKGDITENIEDMVNHIRQLEEEIIDLKRIAEKMDMFELKNLNLEEEIVKLKNSALKQSLISR